MGIQPIFSQRSAHGCLQNVQTYLYIASLKQIEAEYLMICTNKKFY